MRVLNKLDEFCGWDCSPECPGGSQFWRRVDHCGFVSQSNNSTNGSKCHDSVDISLCFEDTAVLYTICAVFWLLGGVVFLCANSLKPRICFNRLHAAKVLLTLLVLVTTLLDLFYTVDRGRHHSVALYQYLSPAVLAVTMLLVLLVMYQERMAGVTSSGILFILWLVLLGYGSFKLRSFILLAQDYGGIRDKFRFSTFCVQFATFFTLMILSVFPEPRPKYAYHNEERKPCPEEEATFLSSITWWWLTGLMWRGWRKSLEYSDLTDLNYEDKSRVVSPTFQRNWNKQVEKSGLTLGRVHVEEHQYQPVNRAPLGDVHVVTVDGHRRRGGPSLVVALSKSFAGPFLVAAFFKLLQDLLTFASPQLLKLMINFTRDSNEPDWKGYFYAVLLFLAAVLESLFLHQYFHRCFVVGMRIRTAVVAAVYRKALRLSNAARQGRTVGEIVNLMSVDAQRFMDFMPYFHTIWSAPLQIILALVFLWHTMGLSIFAGFGVMILFIPVNVAIAAKSRKYEVQQMTQKDKRIKLVNEVLNGIKVIKLYAWEIPFQRLIMGVREKELGVLKATAYLNAGSSFAIYCTPFLVTLVTFATFSLIHKNSEDPANRLTPEKAFVALSLFNILRFPLATLPYFISNIVQASVSLERLRKFLKDDELDPAAVDRRAEPAMDDEDSVSVTRGTFTWEAGEEPRPALSDLELHIKPGQLIAVVGQVGAGKSSLIQALLGEMDKLAGSVTLRGQVAYVPQQAWIQNNTLKGNILFGRPMNGVLYGQTLSGCALEPDLEILPGGDMTEIGEKGINLSGGQKQRVSLARAVYQEADIYLLDDPLSAVDSHVGKHIFEKVVGPEGMLKRKVRILVTHGTGFLPQCDQIVVMNEGRISEIGSYAELIDNDGAFAEFLRTYTNVEEDEEGVPALSDYKEETFEPPLDDTETPGLAEERRQARMKYYEHQRSHKEPSRGNPRHCSSRTDLKRQLSKQLSVTDEERSGAANEGTTLITTERVETGTVRLSVFLTYCKACTFKVSFFGVVLYIASHGASIASNFWLADWSNANVKGNTSSSKIVCNKPDGPDLACYLGIYAALGAAQAVCLLLGYFALALAGIYASRLLHDGMLKNILRSPMSFFDTTPLGRILNRFSKDIYTIDEVIPNSMTMFLVTLSFVTSTVIVVLIVTPVFAVVIVPLGIFYILVQRFYVATSRQLKRLESTTRSPIYSHFQESLTGCSSIRAYQKQEAFMLESEERVDYNQIAYYPSICANRWLAIRLEFVGNLIILFAALFAAIQRNFRDELTIRINPGLVGLSISYALRVTQALNWLVRETSEVETNIVAVERTKEYSETPTEAPAIIDARRPPHDWPSDGHVKFDRYSTRYREGLDLVLKDISIDIPGGIKVGIVGRTGAGKSSLTVALFRIIEASSGGILIDNINIAAFGLHDLRSRITIIPQDPVLFSGTLRLNLDPFESHSNEELWQALESAHLNAFISGLPNRLEHNIAEGGENISVGQRQLVCLARALLRKTKILVLDEATAAVDLETDDLIQKTIRSKFHDCTVLTIAHRLNTILDYDYVMVLDGGRVIEYDPPAKLLNNRNTVFYSMAKDAGLTA